MTVIVPALALILGIVFLYYWLRTPEKSPCPHDLCKYKLPFLGMTDGHGNYVPEKCPACDNWVKWDHGRDRYMRVEPPSLPQA